MDCFIKINDFYLGFFKVLVVIVNVWSMVKQLIIVVFVIWGGEEIFVIILVVLVLDLIVQVMEFVIQLFIFVYVMKVGLVKDVKLLIVQDFLIVFNEDYVMFLLIFLSVKIVLRVGWDQYVMIFVYMVNRF